MFHNGENFNAEAVRVNWEEYRRMRIATVFRFEALPDETIFEIVDDYTVRFTFPEPEGLAFVKFKWLLQFAPAFFAEHKFDEQNWGYPAEPGPWGTGPFELVEGNAYWGSPSERLVLEAYEGYWDPRYPKVKRVIFDVTLIGDRKEAMRLCRESEGAVDIVTHIRPLDTLKVAESPFAKVVKSITHNPTLRGSSRYLTPPRWQREPTRERSLPRGLPLRRERCHPARPVAVAPASRSNLTNPFAAA